MTPSQKQRWVDALRSGKYKQTQGWLNRDDSFCCLGVACDVFKDEVSMEVSQGNYAGVGMTPAYKYTMYDGGSGNLPPKMQAFLGLDLSGRLPLESIPDLGTTGPNTGVPLSLVHLNDERGYDFNKIADVIEKYIPANEPEPEQPEQPEQEESK